MTVEKTYEEGSREAKLAAKKRAAESRGGLDAVLADPAPRLEGDGGGDDRGIETLAPRPIRRAMTFGRDAARAGDDACAMTTVRTTRRRRRRRRVARAEQ